MSTLTKERSTRHAAARRSPAAARPATELPAAGLPGVELPGVELSAGDHPAADDGPAGLVTSCLAGDDRAWRQLVERFSPLVWTIARSHRLSLADCQDVYQLTWLRTVQYLGKLRAPEMFGQWITTTARRESLKCIERNRKHVPVGDSLLLDRPTAGADQPDEALVRYAGHSVVRSAFRKLPPRDQKLLGVLMVDPAPSYDEVSRELGLPRGSIGPLRRRALTRLRALLPEVAVLT
jgi:RNA polymerase sigma factor (sigma-70 family)